MFVSAWLLGCGVLADGSLLEPPPESAAEVPDPVIDHELTPWDPPVEDPVEEPAPSDCDEAWEACVEERGDWLGCEEPYRVCIGGEWPSAYHCERLVETCLGAQVSEEECAAVYWECIEPMPPYDPEAVCYEEYELCIAAGEDGSVCEERLYLCMTY